MRFLSTVLYTVIGIFVALGILVAIIVGIGISATGLSEVNVKDDTVLKFKLTGSLVELSDESPLNELPAPIGNDGSKNWSLLKLLEAIDDATEDERVRGMWVEAGGMGAGFASMTEVRERLKKFHESGKFIYASGTGMGEGQYYIMSVADSIFLHPWGNVELNGLGSEVMFYKGMFDKFGITPEVFRVGDYKSAVEPYLRTSMSDESRYQTEVYLNALYSYYLKEVSQSREISVAELQEIASSMSANTPGKALEQGLVDRIAYKDEVEVAIKQALELEDDDPNFLSLQKYINAEKPFKGEDEVSGDKVAVIVADGTIMDGNGGPGEVGGSWVASQIRKARESKSVKAIVLRINSPGGSALASDIMWREVVRTKGVKPIYASMSDVAASGGYYMAMACDTIVAMPNTITGSIGIFSVYFEVEKLLNKELGLTFEEVATSPLANIGSPTDAFSEEERRVLQEGTDLGYDLFTSKAAEGRGMSQDSLKKLASGRVWIGTDAHKRGLVDVLGTFDDAIALAAQSAGLEENSYDLLYYYKKNEGLKGLLKQASANYEKQQQQFIPGSTGVEKAQSTARTAHHVASRRIPMVMNRTLANILSVVMHPGLMPSVLFATIMLSGKGLLPNEWRFRLTLLGLIFNFTFLLPLLMVWLLYNKGYLSSIRVANRQERIAPFVLISISYTVLAWLFQQRLPSLFMLTQVMGCIALTQVICTLITLRFKISIHSVALSGMLGILVALQILMPEMELFYPVIMAIVLLGLTMTARLRLNAHTPEQVSWGAVFGFGLNFALLLALGYW